MANNIENQDKEELPAPLLEFPCDFPMKIVGLRTDDYANQIENVIKQYDPKFNLSGAKISISSKGKYASISVIVKATSQDMLDNLYKALTSHPLTRFVL